MIPFFVLILMDADFDFCTCRLAPLGTILMHTTDTNKTSLNFLIIVFNLHSNSSTNDIIKEVVTIRPRPHA
jgi:hypothetical protein